MMSLPLLLIQTKSLIFLCFLLQVCSCTRRRFVRFYDLYARNILSAHKNWIDQATALSLWVLLLEGLVQQQLRSRQTKNQAAIQHWRRFPVAFKTVPIHRRNNPLFWYCAEPALVLQLESRIFELQGQDSMTTYNATIYPTQKPFLMWIIFENIRKRLWPCPRRFGPV